MQLTPCTKMSPSLHRASEAFPQLSNHLPQQVPALPQQNMQIANINKAGDLLSRFSGRDSSKETLRMH